MWLDEVPRGMRRALFVFIYVLNDQETTDQRKIQVDLFSNDLRVIHKKHHIVEHA